MLTESQINMLKKQKEFSLFGENTVLNSFFGFWLYIAKKIIFTCTSVKVWSLVGFSWLNTWLLINGHLESSGFTAISIALITTVLVTREYSKSSHNSIVDKIKENPIVGKLTDALDNRSNNEEYEEELND